MLNNKRNSFHIWSLCQIYATMRQKQRVGCIFVSMPQWGNNKELAPYLFLCHNEAKTKSWFHICFYATMKQKTKSWLHICFYATMRQKTKSWLHIYCLYATITQKTKSWLHIYCLYATITQKNKELVPYLFLCHNETKTKSWFHICFYATMRQKQRVGSIFVSMPQWYNNKELVPFLFLCHVISWITFSLL